MKKVIYMDNIEELAKKLKDYSEKDINDKIVELKNLPLEFVWEGPGYQNYMVGYKQKINKIDKLNHNLCMLGDFLIKVKDNFRESNEQIQKYYQELIEELKDLDE